MESLIKFNKNNLSQVLVKLVKIYETTLHLKTN